MVKLFPQHLKCVNDDFIKVIVSEITDTVKKVGDNKSAGLDFTKNKALKLAILNITNMFAEISRRSENIKCYDKGPIRIGTVSTTMKYYV